MRDPRASLVAVAIALALFGACSSSGSKGTADTTVPTAPPETTTTAAGDPFAIPEVINEAYVNRVLAELNRVRGDAVRRIVSKGTIDFDSIQRIRAIYSDPEFDVALQGLRDQLERGLEGFKRPPGDRIATVVRIVRARPSCILALATFDFSQVVRDAQAPEPGEVQAITLRPSEPDADPNRLNPTHWSISFEEVLNEADISQSQECAD